MESRNNGLHLSPPWISPASGWLDREVPPVIVVPRRRPQDSGYDSDAANYIARVEAADGQELEPSTKTAINNFIVGCKTDGIWTAIKASCILAGARTLAGALVPLVGTAPTNVGFLVGDYNRKTGLKGNASTKYLNSNTAPNSVAQNNAHLSLYITQAATTNNTKYMGCQDASNNAMRLIDNIGTLGANINSSSGYFAPAGSSQRTGLIGASVNSAQAAANQMSIRYNSTTFTGGNTLSATLSLSIFIFGRNLNGTVNQATDARISFYSFGESLLLSSLDARIVTLMNEFSTIP